MSHPKPDRTNRGRPKLRPIPQLQSQSDASVADAPTRLSADDSSESIRFDARAKEGLQQFRDLLAPVGDYDVLAILATGGMSAICKARHRLTGQVVVLKRLLPNCIGWEYELRLQREMQVLTHLNHPNLIKAFDSFDHGKQSCLILEYVEGMNLQAYVRRFGCLPPLTAMHYILQAAEGLSAAHVQGVIHRDIKPENLLLTADGVIKLLDFGLARCENSPLLEPNYRETRRLTNEHAILGTPDYMAPEQADNPRNADVRSDMYSLGYTLYYLLTGKRPYSYSSLTQKFLAHRREPIPTLADRLACPPAGLQEFFEKMVAKEPSDRFQTMFELITAIRQLVNPASQPARLRKSPWQKLLSAVAGWW